MRVGKREVKVFQERLKLKKIFSRGVDRLKHEELNPDNQCCPTADPCTRMTTAKMKLDKILEVFCELKRLGNIIDAQLEA